MVEYLCGFGNHFVSEKEPHTVPLYQNSPQKVAHGLYAEQLSGSAFTAPRHHNSRSWLYRIRPSVIHSDFTHLDHHFIKTAPFNEAIIIPPTQMRWDPQPLPDAPTDFIQGLKTFAGHGNASTFTGAAIHLYAINQSMTTTFFYNADGDLLIVPQQGGLRLKTEFGIMEIQPGEIAVIPRGIRFQVQLLSEHARGYVCENYGAHFILPELGPIGSNGLANPRDFLSPVADYETTTGNFTLIVKFQGRLFTAKLTHTPLDVVGWHGNYVPYKYDLNRFNTINTVSFDHPDPSIFTVLTSPSTTPGTANLDFVIFPPRWMVAEDTFRPPYYHRNIMSEFMGLIYGTYDAKEEDFVPGGASLHNCMSAHGPDKDAFDKATNAALKPQYYKGTMAFMFESHFVWQPTRYALEGPERQTDYLACWQTLEAHFKIR